jgi:AbiU2
MEESPEDIRNERIRDMGTELGTVYDLLWKDGVWLHAKWRLYRQLYANSPERVAFKAAGHFFGAIQRTLFEDVILNLMRLNDPLKSGSKDNLALRRLPGLITDESLASKLQELVDAASNASLPMRDWRNWRLAHRDLAVALATTSDPVPGISRADIEAALRAVQAVFDCIEGHYWHREPMDYHQHFVPAGGDAERLVHYLQEGVRAEQRKMRCLLAGKPLPEDLEP